MTLLTNGGNTHDFYEDLYREIFAELSGLEMKAPVKVPERARRRRHHARSSARTSARRCAWRCSSATRARCCAPRCSAPWPSSSRDPVDEYPLVALDDDLYAVRAPGTQTWITVTFYSLPTGEEYLHFGARATPKVSDEVANTALTRIRREGRRAGMSETLADARTETIVAHIERLVSVESPSADAWAVARSALEVAALGEELLGVEPERIVDRRA